MIAQMVCRTMPRIPGSPCLSSPPDDICNFFATFLEGTREHAPYFALSADKQENEADVARVLSEEMLRRGDESFHSVQSRRQGSDPPDCEAIGRSGQRVGIEVTELVDGGAIKGAITGTSTPHRSVTPSTAIGIISGILRRKDRGNVRGGPYDLYILVICCDDPCFLDHEVLAGIREAAFERTRLIDLAYFLTSYDPWQRCCPYIELALTVNSNDA